MKVDVQKIHENSMKILAETGMKFHHPDAIKVLKEHGIRVTDSGIAYFTEKEIMEYISKAPDLACLYANNPKYNVVIGRGDSNNAPCGGATKILKRDGTTRECTLDDMVKMIKLFEANDNYKINGGTPCQPEEVPAEIAAVLLHYIAINLTDKSLWTATGTYEQMEAVMKMAMLRYGIDKKEFAANPRVFTMINTNTPLQFDKNQTETLFTFLKYRQPIAITSAAMGGTTAPVTLAGELSVINAEVIAAVALSQMYAPGAPVLYGSQSSNADMKTCSLAIGSPEGALCYKYAKKMAEFYNIPCRAGGALTDAKMVNAQAGYESMLTYLSCRQSGVDVICQSAGIMDGYLSVSYDKMIVDFEIINYVNKYLNEFLVNTETSALDTIHEIGPAGQFLLEEHTLEYCRKEPCQPLISVRGPQSDPIHAFETNIDKKLEEMVHAYNHKALSSEIREKLRNVMKDYGIEKKYIELADKCIDYSTGKQD